MIITILDLTVSILKTVYKCVKVFKNMSKHCKKKLVICANYHDIVRLLLLTSIFSSKITQYRLLTKKISRLIGKTG